MRSARFSHNEAQKAQKKIDTISVPRLSVASGPVPRHEIQDFARFAFGDDFERPAADFTVRGETLRRDAGVDDQPESLAAERALNVRRDFHRLMAIRPRVKSNAVGILPGQFSFSMASNSRSEERRVGKECRSRW